jgi:hypothetical protein
VRAATLAALGLGVAACGGGGGDGEPDAAPVVGPVSVTGVVRYEDRAPELSGFLSATRTPVPARGVSVSLVDMSGAMLGSAVTADDGSFTIDGPAITYGEPIHVLAATMSSAPARPIEVIRGGGAGLVHGFRAPDFAAAPSAQADVLVTESSGEAGAFNVFDQLVGCADYIGALGGTPEPVTAVWQRNSNDGTYYLDSENTMYLLGLSSDDDGYDDHVILHEAGHYMEDSLGRSDSPGGAHGGEPVDPRLAWSEGYSTYWAMSVLGAPIYIDTMASGGWSYNAETTVTAANINGAIGQPLSEDTVTEILWDLGDDGPDDPFAGTHEPVAAVQLDYLRTAVLRVIGQGGVDLVDFLDGFFLADGLGRCAEVRTIVEAVHRFPYDFAGPAGACP